MGLRSPSSVLFNSLSSLKGSWTIKTSLAYSSCISACLLSFLSSLTLSLVENEQISKPENNFPDAVNPYIYVNFSSRFYEVSVIVRRQHLTLQSLLLYTHSRVCMCPCACTRAHTHTHTHILNSSQASRRCWLGICWSLIGGKVKTVTASRLQAALRSSSTAGTLSDIATMRINGADELNMYFFNKLTESWPLWVAVF